MQYMLSRNRVKDFEQWKAVFSSHQEAHKAAGLELISILRKVEDPNDFYFVFKVESLEKAQAFIDDPASAEAGQDAGVIDGEYHFVEDAGRY